MLSVESLSGLNSISQSKSEETLKVSKDRDSVIAFKMITLIFSGLTGIATLELFGGMLWSLDDLEYYALLDQIEVIGYICTGFVVVNIVTSLVFKRNMLVFIIFSFLTAIFGSFQFIVFAISPFGVADKVNGLLGHYQYVITFVMSLMLLIFTYVYIIVSRKK